MAFYTRAQLEHLGVLEPPRPSHLSVRKDPITGQTTHWEAGMEAFTSFARLHAIQQQFFAKGYGDLPYDGLFDGQGNIFAGRDLHWVGAHAESANNIANRTTVGLCYMEPAGSGVTGPALQAWNFCTGMFHLRFGKQPQHFSHSYWARTVGKATQCCGTFKPVILNHGGKV